MKLRSMIGFCALAVAAFGLESNTCGLMNVPSTAKTTMIAVPWVTVGGTADAMKVANLVKTDTLSAGDELYYYDESTGTYYCWKLQDGAWKKTTTASQAGTFTAPTDDYAIARGKGLFLVRQDTSKEIWLYGQAGTGSVSVKITAGAYNMIANPNTTAYDIKDVAGGVGDQVIAYDATGKQILYTKDGEGWYRMAPSETGVTIGGVTRYPSVKTYSGCTIPAGQGAWYVSKSEATPTIGW